MLQLLSHGVDYWWILCAMGISVFSHISRAARWRIQLDALGIKPPFMAICCSIFGCYALNLVFPRLGELWRCTYISHRQKGSFPSVFGSMLADRISDTIMVCGLIVLTLIVASPAIRIFLDKYPLGRDFISLISQGWFWTAIIGGIILAGFSLYLLRHHPFMVRLKEIFLNMWKGFIIILHMKGRIKFIFLTFAIWGCYFIQLYVAFYAFGFTRALCSEPGTAVGLVPCLVAFVLSSISMAIPSNGGLGPWNIAIMFALSIYGVSDDEGAAFSILQWGGQTVMLILLGIFTMVYISLGKEGRQGEEKLEGIKN